MQVIITLMTFAMAIVVLLPIIAFVCQHFKLISGCLVTCMVIFLIMKGCSFAASTIAVSTPIGTRSIATTSPNDVSESTANETTTKDEIPLEEAEEETISYAIGKDIPPGIYKLIANEADHEDKVVRVYPGVNQPPLSEEDFNNTAYLEVEKGQILEFSSSLTYMPIDSVEPMDCSNLRYPCSLDGWYLIGTDLPAGLYRISKESGNLAMYGVYDTIDLPWAQRIDAIDGALWGSERDTVRFDDGQFVWFRGCEAYIDPSGTTHMYEPQAHLSEETNDEDGQSKSTDRRERTVYITASGYRYHSNTRCRGLNNANEVYTVTLGEAEDRGFTPCKICH